MAIDQMTAEILVKFMPGLPKASNEDFWGNVKQLIFTVGTAELMNQPCNYSSAKLHESLSAQFLFVPYDSEAYPYGFRPCPEGATTIGQYLWKNNLRPRFIYGSGQQSAGKEVTIYCLAAFDYDAYFAGQIDERRDHLIILAKQSLEVYRQLIEQAAEGLKQERFPNLSQRKPQSPPGAPEQRLPRTTVHGQPPFCCHCGRSLPQDTRLSQWSWCCLSCNGKRLGLGQARFCRRCGAKFIPAQSGSAPSQTFKRTCSACTRPRSSS